LRYKANKIPKKWVKIITLIPGYDSRRDAGNYVFDTKIAKFVIDFFPKHLRHIEGDLVGQPYYLEPHEQAITANIFAWIDPDTGYRRYTEVFYFVARKNSKTTWVAGIGCLVTFTDKEIGQQNYCAAADVEQADYTFRIAKEMIVNDEELNSLAKLYRRSIICEDTNSFFKVISSTADTKHGGNNYLNILDELHVVPRDLVDVLVTGTASRSQPLTIYTTTSDYERISICNEKHEYASKVRDGLITDPRFLPVIYEASHEDDWKAEKTWYKANPNLGKSVKIDYLRRECKKAEDSPSYENIFKRLHLNIKTEQITRWLSMEKWLACGTSKDPIAWRNEMLEKMKGKSCVGGLDLGSVSDLTAFVPLFRDGGDIVAIPYFWVCSEGWHKKDSRHKALYETWIRQGFIIETSGSITDYSKMRADIKDFSEDHVLTMIAVDYTHQAVETSTRLMDEDGFDVVAVKRGAITLAGSCQTFEEKVIEGTFKHGNNPVLTWMASNVAVKTDPSGKPLSPVKPDNKGPLKIDGIVATLFALDRLMVQPENTGSGYSDPAWDEYIKEHSGVSQ